MFHHNRRFFHRLPDHASQSSSGFSNHKTLPSELASETELSKKEKLAIRNAKIVADYSAKMPVSEITRKYGVSEGTVWRACHIGQKIMRRNQSILRALKEGNLSQRKIAKKYGVDQAYVSKLHTGQIGQRPILSLKKIRNEQMRRERARGHTLEDIAKKHKMSYERTKFICRGVKIRETIHPFRELKPKKSASLPCNPSHLSHSYPQRIPKKNAKSLDYVLLAATKSNVATPDSKTHLSSLDDPSVRVAIQLKFSHGVSVPDLMAQYAATEVEILGICICLLEPRVKLV